MRIWRSPLASTFLLAAGVILVVLAIALLLALTGHMVTGVKVAIFVILFPGVPILAAGLLILVRDPGSHHTSRGVAAILIAAGGLLVLVPLLFRLPFRETYHIGRLPLALAVPFVLGVGLVAAGISALFIESLVDDWRHRAYPEALANLLAILVVIWVSAWLVSNRLG